MSKNKTDRRNLSHIQFLIRYQKRITTILPQLQLKYVGHQSP